MSKRLVLVVLLLIALALAVAAVASANQPISSDVYWFDPFPERGAQVPGAGATLNTNESGATVQFQTSELTSGNAYTAWWIIFNNPGACADDPCNLGDLGNAAVSAEIAYATGHVIGGSGNGNFGAHLPAGDTPGGWFGNGFTNPTEAEVHVLIHDHGPSIPGLVDEMISTYRGGCQDDAVINLETIPPTGYYDGTPGPNQCPTVQFAIFQQ
jgi:opacity protein-like surface antigen